MYARVIFAQFRPEQTDEIIQRYREAVVTEHRKQPGSKGTMVLIDRAAGKGISMTFWETEADLPTNCATRWCAASAAERECTGRYQGCWKTLCIPD
jgi:heme-degrading monooxygenase HmoA